jgi:tRNA (guanine37-N1)-methyltransferase
VQSIITIPASLEIANPSSKRLVLLDPSINQIKGKRLLFSLIYADLDSLPEEIKIFAQQANAQLTSHEIELNYDYWTVEQVLKAILPDELEVPTGFATIGHIAHFNLRPEYQPFKKIIGQVVLDKNPTIKTVVNKTDNIDHTFRFFSMEILAGEQNTEAKMREGQCTFTFDFAKVYWNSRLQGEHDRVVKMFKQSQRVCDVFGGVGPFALPAARNSYCTVFANDLNPVSYEYLLKNIQANKVGHRVAAFNMDGREFIQKSLTLIQDSSIWDTFDRALHYSVRRTDKNPPKPIERGNYFHHYLMNLPATATEFLDAFIGLYHGSGLGVEELPMIHCYSFSKATDPEKDTLEVSLYIYSHG